MAPRSLSIVERLRQARLNLNLSQSAVAAKVGAGQNQISQMERGIVDPRLSTVVDVARALDFELMVVPRHLLPVVDGLQRVAGEANRPLYALDDDESEVDADTQRAVRRDSDDDDEHRAASDASHAGHRRGKS